MAARILPTHREVSFDPAELIVSKTDPKGRITYANGVFCRVAGYTEAELIGAPHSIIRHPDMPRAVFKLLWDVLAEGREVFAYVKNMAKNGDHYWVHAHVTPSRDRAGALVGYHSSRRVPERRIVDTVIAPLYRDLVQVESRHANAREGLAASYARLLDVPRAAGVSYDQLVFQL